MVQESETSRPIPISQARSKRELSPKIETTSDELRQVLSEIIDQQVAAKITRLETSIDRMLNHIDAVARGEAEDSALRVTTDYDAADLASVTVELPPEDFYRYTCDLLAEKLGVRRHDVLKMIEDFGLRGDKHYHRLIQTGRKSQISKWSDAAYVKLKEALESGEYKPSNPR